MLSIWSPSREWKRGRVEVEGGTTEKARSPGWQVRLEER